MKVLILAAGYATRLSPWTLANPKPLLKVGGEPILDRILDKVAQVKGVSEAYIVVNNKFFENFKSWLEGSAHRGKPSLINDGTDSNETRLGAMKDIELVIDQKAIDDDLLVIAADNLFDFDLASFLAFTQKHRDGAAVALYDIKDLDAAKRYGVVKIDEDSRVVNFQEKPPKPESTLVSTGVYYFPKDTLASIKEYNTKPGLNLDAPGYYISWLAAMNKVYGFTFREPWYDIGDIETYKKVDAEYTKKES